MLVPRSFLLVLVALALAPQAAKAEYPDRPITAIVPFAPGGPADIIGRILSTFMPPILGQSVVIENRGQPFHLTAQL
jgi:tripartite-type tricarboxylate transporter receptor subunit TctC